MGSQADLVRRLLDHVCIQTVNILLDSCVAGYHKKLEEMIQKLTFDTENITFQKHSLLAGVGSSAVKKLMPRNAPKHSKIT